MSAKPVGVLCCVVFILSTRSNVCAQGHEFPSSDIFVAQARARDIVCRDSMLERIPPHGSDAWIRLEIHEAKEFGTNPDTIVSNDTAAENYISSALSDLYEGRLHCPANAATKALTVLPIRPEKPLPTPVSDAPLVQRCTETKTLANNPPPWAGPGWKPPEVGVPVNSCEHLDPGYTKCSCKTVHAVHVCPNGMPPWRCSPSDLIWR
jgi:hypothetical protein